MEQTPGERRLMEHISTNGSTSISKLVREEVFTAPDAHYFIDMALKNGLITPFDTKGHTRYKAKEALPAEQ